MLKISKWSNILVFQFSFSNSAPKRSTILSHNWTSRGPVTASGTWKKVLLKHVFLSKCFRLIFDTLQPEGWGPHSRFQSKLFGSQQNRHLGRILPATTKVMAQVCIYEFFEHEEEERNLSKVSLWKEQRWYAHRLSCDIDHYILQQNIKYPQLKITLTVNKIIFSI